MTAYTPPLQDMAFVLNHVVGLQTLPGAAELDAATVDAILEEAGKLARDVLAPLNQSGDKTGCTLKDGAVTTPPGFREAYAQYRDGGWNAVPFNPEHGGQGLPWALAFAVQEMWQSANMSFGLCPLLNQGAVEALEQHGSEAQKGFYLEKLISGEWTGTMNLTEPQAGSDLAAVASRAERNNDGTYRIFGQKIFITYGEHDFAGNIIHLVLARLPGAPEGVRGISLFLVPKFLPDGTRNDVLCTGIEHKLGIHASPTCTMQYGDKGGAVGTLVGRENEGLKCMFTMMNNARLNVGLQGVAIAERAYQKALAYARERVQGKGLDGSGDHVAIIHHADVKRMLLTMRAQVEAVRALAYDAALASDLARGGDAAAQAKVDLLTPLVKAWGTDMAVEVASLGVQVHGGMGFIEETGAAQYYRDARILPIYEGTNGIQANDLVFRKVARDGGQSALAWIDAMAGHVEAGLLGKMKAATQAVVALAKASPDEAAAISMPYLKAFSLLSGAAMLARSVRALDGAEVDAAFATRKRQSETFFRLHILPQAAACLDGVSNGAACISGVGVKDF